VLVDPIYSVQTTRSIFGKRSNAQVVGFAAYYKNSRDLKAIEDALAAEKIEKEKQEIQTSIKNYKAFANIGSTSSIKEIEYYRLDENCKPCPIYKIEDRTKSTEEFFKFLSIKK
jgi:CRISPR/Cas system CSM-associated protein Csm4 (group 5 of RAMP superfamily)